MSGRHQAQHDRRAVVVKLAVALLLACLALTWWTQARPTSMGGPLTVVTVSGVSMEPRLRDGDLALIQQRDSYGPGDVVAFRTEGPDAGHYVIHRIVGGTSRSGFVTRGDNNSWDDPWSPTGSEVAGRMVADFAGAGDQLSWLLDPSKLAAILAGVTVMAVMLAEPRRRPSHRASLPGTPAALAESVRRAGARS